MMRSRGHEGLLTHYQVVMNLRLVVENFMKVSTNASHWQRRADDAASMVFSFAYDATTTADKTSTLAHCSTSLSLVIYLLRT